MITFYYLLCFLPLIAAVALLILKTEYKQALRFSLILSLLELILSLAVFALPSADSWGLLSGSHSGFVKLMLFLTAFSFFLALKNIDKYPDLSPNKEFLSFYFMMLGGVMGFFTAKDLRIGFIFFEIMSLSSWALMSYGKSPNRKRASYIYLGVTIICGMIGLYGLIVLNKIGGSAALSEINSADTLTFIVAAVLFSVGYAAKAGLFPLHFWVPSAYTLAPFPITSLLSAIVKKTGVFGLILVSLHFFSGNLKIGATLLILSIVTMLLGALMALLSPDFKYTLACSSISQLGFITLGISLLVFIPQNQNAVALAGTLLHSINHTLSKLILFSLSGIVFYKLGSYDLNELRGALKRYPLLALSFMLPMLSLAGIPFFSGYLSKTLLHEGLYELMHHFDAGALGMVLFVSEKLFLLTGGLTFAYMLKLFYTVFIVKPERETALNFENKEILPYTAMGLLLFVLGAFPELVTRGLISFGIAGLSEAPLPEIHFMSGHNLQGAVISICAGLLIFFVVVKVLMMRGGSFKTPFYDGYKGFSELCALPLKGIYYLGYALASVPNIVINDKLIYSFFNLLAQALDKSISFLFFLIYKLVHYTALALDKGVELFFSVIYSLALFFSRATDTLVNVGFKGIIILLLKNQNKNVHPEHDEFFSSYAIASKKEHSFKASLLYGLILCLLGFVATMAYLIIKNI